MITTEKKLNNVDATMVTEEKTLIPDDPKAIQTELGIQCKASDKTNELIRCIRFQMQSLLASDLEEKKLRQM